MRKKEEIKELIGYTTHDGDCILSQLEAGEPTKNGYRQKYAGKWYQSRPIDKRPKCNCGLDDLIKIILNQ